MADAKRYQVVAACVLLPVRAADGSEVFNTIYRPATVWADPDNYRVKHNVDSGYIVEVGDDAAAGVDAAGAPLLDDERHDGSNAGDPLTVNDPGRLNEPKTQQPDGDKADAPRRGRPSADEKKSLVDQAVRAGMDRGEAEKASVADLRAALANK